MGPLVGYFAEFFAAEGAASSAAAYQGAGALAESWGAATVAEGVGTQAGVQAAQGAAASQAAAGLTTGEMLQYMQQGASLLQGVSGYASGNANAAYNKDAAKRGLQVGAANKNIKDAVGRAQLGEIRAQMGAQGTTASGSPMLVYLDSVRNAAIASQTEYWQGEIGAASYKEQERLARRRGEADLWSGIIGAAAPSLKSGGARLLA